MRYMLDLIGLLELASFRGQAETCTPTRLVSLLRQEDVASHRSLSCPEYDACLAEVLRRRWSSWSCRRCVRFAFRGAARALEVSHEGARRIER